MATASPPTPITELRRWLERTENHDPAAAAVLPFGVTVIDDRLPGGGLQRGYLHEIIEGGPAGEFAAIATLFTAGVTSPAFLDRFSGAAWARSLSTCPRPYRPSPSP
jgi:protein ImuA